MPELPAQFDDLALAATDGLSTLPWGAHMIFALTMGVGMIMWLSGRRLLRPVYALLFAVTGGMLGFFGPSSAGIQADPYIGLAVGAILGLIVGGAMFRISMALSLSAVGSVVLPLLVGGILALAGDPAVQNATAALPDPDQIIADFMRDMETTSENEEAPSEDTESATSENGAMDDVAEIAIEASKRIRNFAVALGDDARTRINEMPPRHQLLLLIAWVAGGALGFSLGFGFPSRVAAVSTAFVGAAVWLPSAAWLLNALGADIGRVVPGAATTWLALWFGVSVVGVLLQWTALKPRADEPRD